MAMAANVRKFKVRTGCITCKIRKIKCDEGKPNCLRCTSTGRKCDGYAKVEAEDSEKQTSLVLGQSTRILVGGNALYADSASLSANTSASEHRWLKYFSQHVGPALSGLGDKDFWTHVLPQLSISEPAIRHALLAVGSSYAQFEAHSKINSVIGVIEHNHSVKHYSLAIADLQRSLLQASGDATMPLICCLLFICLECLYGNQPLALDHLDNGLKILSSTRSRSKGTNVVTVQSIKQKVERIFARLDTQSTISGKPSLLPSGDPTLAFDLQIPHTFGDRFEAKMYLDTINSMSLNFIRLANDGTLLQIYQDGSAIILQRRLQEHFMAWRNALDNFDRLSPPKDTSHKDTIARLRIEYYASFIYLSNCLEMEESCYDAYSTQFAALVSLARSVLPSPEESTLSELASLSITPATSVSPAFSAGFTLEASLIPSLYLTAIKCRDPVIRRGAVALLERNNGREGLWDARVNWRLARRIVEIEERSMLMDQGATEAFMEDGPSMRMQASNGAVLTDLPSEKFRIINADLTLTFEEEPRPPAILTFYTRPHGILEPEHSWEEELWL